MGENYRKNCIFLAESLMPTTEFFRTKMAKKPHNRTSTTINHQARQHKLRTKFNCGRMPTTTASAPTPAVTLPPVAGGSAGNSAPFTQVQADDSNVGFCRYLSEFITVSVKRLAKITAKNSHSNFE
jgi:hypothetical protein